MLVDSTNTSFCLNFTLPDKDRYREIQNITSMVSSLREGGEGGEGRGGEGRGGEGRGGEGRGGEGRGGEGREGGGRGSQQCLYAGISISVLHRPALPKAPRY